MIRKTFLLFDTNSGNSILTVDLSTDNPSFSYSLDQVWDLLEKGAPEVKNTMQDPTKNACFLYEANRLDEDFKKLGMHAFKFDLQTKSVVKKT